jgi:hypothetical protein
MELGDSKHTLAMVAVAPPVVLQKRLSADACCCQEQAEQRARVQTALPHREQGLSTAYG